MLLEREPRAGSDLNRCPAPPTCVRPVHTGSSEAVWSYVIGDRASDLGERAYRPAAVGVAANWSLVMEVDS